MVRETAAIVGVLLAVAGGCTPTVDAVDEEADERRLVRDIGPRAMVLADVLGGAADPMFKRARPGRALEFPRDHGAHPDYRTEWWYLVVALTANAEPQREFGAQFTLFRQALQPDVRDDSRPWDLNQVYLAHAAVTDVKRQAHRHAQRLVRGHPRLAGALSAPFRLWADGWQLEEEGGRWLLDATTDEFAYRLEFAVEAPPLLHGNRGYSAKGVDQASYYYSMPRLRAEGELTIEGRTHQVRGRGWFDHEWSTSVLPDELLGWDWLTLTLDDERRLMVFQLRRRDGARDAFDHGTLVGADGSINHLSPAQFSMRPTRFWHDTDGTRWPVGWRVTLHEGAAPETFDVDALMDDQLMDTALTYWEGLVAARNQSGERIGSGYLELTGYSLQ